MPVMMSKLYHALLNAGADEESARSAAEEAAQYEQRFNSIDIKFAEIRGELTWLKWMVGTNIVLTLGVLWKLIK